MAKDPPKDNTVYQKVEYWDDRFQHEEHYEWLASYKDVRGLIAEFVKLDDRVLIVGCGNSSLGPDMYADGYHNLTCVDYSSVVIERMKALHSNVPEIKWIVADVRYLAAFEDGRFDVVLDKATMDALVTAEGSAWQPNDATVNDVDSMCRQASRVLRLGGLFVQITFQQPHFRRRYLLGEQSGLAEPEEKFSAKYGWHVGVARTIDCGLGYFFLVCRKE